MDREKEFAGWMRGVANAAMRHCHEDEGPYAGAAGALRLARECGPAIADFGEYGEKQIGSTYSGICVIAFGLSPPVDAKAWFDELRSSYERERDRRKERGIFPWSGK